MYNNFEITRAFMPSITTNHAITYTKYFDPSKLVFVSCCECFEQIRTPPECLISIELLNNALKCEVN